MRSILLTVGGLCSIAVVVVVGRFGLMSSEDLTVAAPAAAWNVGVAMGALGGLAVAQSAWRASKAASLFYALVWLALVAVNVGNSIGFLAVKGQKQDATASHSASTLSADRATLTQKQDERARLRFEPTTQAQVDAAERAAQNAQRAADQECGRTVPKAPKAGPGDRCEGKDMTAAAANTELVRVIGEKAKTDSAKKLDAEIDALKAKIEAAAPETGSADSAQGAAFARIINSTGWFEVTAMDAESWRHFGLAMAFELLIICCFSAAELEGRKRPAQVADKPAVKTGLPENPVIDPEPMKIVPPPRPKLVAARSEPPAGPVARIMTEALEPAPRARADLADCYKRYARECRATGSEPMTPDQFVDAMGIYCKDAGIKTKIEGDNIYLLKVRLVQDAA